MQIVDVTMDNIDLYSPTCFLKKDNLGYLTKVEWLKERFKEGLKIKVLYDESDKKIHSFIEYSDGAKAWRAVDAKGYLFINCIWTYPNAYKNKGHNSSLLEEVEKEAKDMLGVAAITSDGPFMASKDIFIKNGYKIIEVDGEHQLMVKQTQKGPLPKILDCKKELEKYQGWHILYTCQCPWVLRFINELDPKIVKDYDFKITELKTAEDVQKSPSLAASFSLIHDGKILADHYVSMTGFTNKLKKGIGKAT